MACFKRKLSLSDGTATARALEEFRNSIDRTRNLSECNKPASSIIKPGPLPMDLDMSLTTVNFGRQIINSPEHSTASDLRRKLIEKEAELQHAHALITQLKMYASEEGPKRKKATLSLEQKLDTCKTQLEAERERNHQLSQELKSVANHEEERKALFLAKREKWIEEHKRLGSSLKEASKENATLKSELQELKLEQQDVNNSMLLEIMQLKSDLTLSEDELKSTKETHAIELRQAKESYEMENSNLKRALEYKIKTLERNIQEKSDSFQLVNSMKNDLKRLIDQEKELALLKEENKAYRSTMENTILLKEKLHSLQSRLIKDEDYQKQLSEAKIEVESLRSKLESWEKLAENGSPSMVSNRLSNLQKTELIYKMEVGNLKTELGLSQASSQRQEKEIQSLNQELKLTKSNFENLNINFRKMKRRQLLLAKECDSYKRVISSYESEATLNLSDLQLDRIKRLEHLVEEYKNTIQQEKTEGAIFEVDSKMEEIQRENQNLKIRLNEIEAEMKQLKSSNEGDLKIVHFRLNPVTAAQERHDKNCEELKQENVLLKNKIQLLIEKGNIEDLTIQSRERIKEMGGSENIQNLKDQISSAEQKNKRMMEAFKRSSQEFREVCYLLTGYKIDLVQPRKYRLSNMFAEKEEDYFLFELSADKKVLLLETEYSKTLTELIEEYLLNRNCIPALLSSLTLELFNHQSMTL